MRFGDAVDSMRPSVPTANKVRCSLGVLLLVLGLGKTGGLFINDINWKMGDLVLIWVPHSMVFVIAALVEMNLGTLLILKNKKAHSLDHTLFAWVGCLMGYQIIRSFYKIVPPCRCIGLWQHWLGLSDTAANIASLVSLGLLGLGCLMIGLENTESQDSHSSQPPLSLP